MPITLVIEDGSGVLNANVYSDVTYVDNYHSDRGHASWASFDAEKKKSCMIRATDYVEKRFGLRYRGRRLSRDQGLQWPRADAYDDSGYLFSSSSAIPKQLKMAIAEYSLRAGLMGELAPDPIPLVPRQDLSVVSPTLPEDADPIGPVRRFSEVVDKIEETKSFATPDQVNNGETLPEYPAADLYLKEILRSTVNRRLARGD